ncbi:MAG: tetratricopeptide repeat protein [Terriglobia bacterium]
MKQWLPVLGLAATSLIALRATCQTAHASQTQDRQLMIQAKEAEERHDFLGAAGIYQRLLKTNPNQPDVLQHLGLVYYLSGRFAQAIPPLKEAVELDPSLWGSELFLGISYYRSGEFERAATSLRQTMTLQPDLPEAEFWYGSTLIAQGQSEAAIPYLSRAAKSSRTALEAQSLLANAYQETGKSYDQRLMKLDPDSYRAHQLKAESLEWQGRDNASLLEYQRALKQKPNLEGVHRAMGVLYWQRRNYDLAARQFEAELRLNPLDNLSNLRLGEYWLAQAKPRIASPYLLSALANHTTEAGEAWHFLGLAELDQQHPRKAVLAFQRAVQANPQDPSNHQMLMRLYAQMGRPDLAEKERLLLEKLPNSPQAH